MAKTKDLFEEFTSKINAERAVRAEIAKIWGEDVASICAVNLHVGVKDKQSAEAELSSLKTIAEAKGLGVIVGYKDGKGGNIFLAKVFLPERDADKIAQAAITGKKSA